MITLEINIDGGLLTLKNIDRSDLSRILGWYNSDDVFRYATGIERTVAMEELEDKFNAIKSSGREFFLGIYRTQDHELLGVVNGSLMRRTLWIKLLAVAAGHRRMGYGSTALRMILDHFGRMGLACDCYLSVIEKNDAGRSFWRTNGFTDVKRLRKHRLFEGIECDVIIMHMAI